MIRPFRLAALALAVAVSAAGCAALDPSPVPVVETAARAPELSTFMMLARESGLAPELAGAGPFTLFAPTDEAFKAVPAKTLDELKRQPAQLKAVLAYHVALGRLSSQQVTMGKAKTLNGAELALAKAGTLITVEDAVVVRGDMAATNGVVHAIDRVLLPPKR